MKYETCPDSTTFYKVKGLNKPITEYLRYSVKQTFRYYKDGSWYVHRNFVVPLTQLGFNHFGEVDYSALPPDLKDQIDQEHPNWKKGKPKVSSDTISHKVKVEQAYATLFLTPDAPMFLVEKVWKELAKVHHPDKGGKQEDFIRILEAYKLIMSTPWGIDKNKR